MTKAAASAPPAPPRVVIYRHRLVVRLTHWVNVITLSLLLMSGLQIFNAHPHLYWGQYGANADAPWLEMVGGHDAQGKPQGVTHIGAASIVTTGVLGVSAGAAGQPRVRGFPRWLTLPADQDLATGRLWHFALAWVFVINGLVYLGFGVANGHFRRDLAPTFNELKPRSLLGSIVDHIKLKHPAGEAARRYNILQKLAYLGVVFLLLPVMVATGLTMSPGFDAFAPWLLDVFGGRQSARSIHFISANLIVLFVIVHVVEVFLAGVFNEMRSMITGRYALPREHAS